jgi:hypothetical protein
MVRSVVTGGMELLGGDEGPIDIHEYRHGLKLHTETRETSQWENKRGYGCPACGEVFDRLLVTGKRHNSFSPSTADPFCIRRESDRLFLFRH